MDDYDEFGNYIGADLSGSESDDELAQSGSRTAGAPGGAAYLSDEDGADEDLAMREASPDGGPVERSAPSNAIILHEEKKYYSTAQELYGEDVETMVQEEDAQPLTEPIIAPIVKKKFRVLHQQKTARLASQSADKQQQQQPETRFDKDFLLDLSTYPELIRNVAVVGHLHHGKTSLLDMLVHETHVLDWDTDKPIRYTDAHMLEQSRKISLTSTPISLVLPTSKGKSYLLNLIDTPGHVNFQDEVAVAARVCDGALLVVDAVEGALANTETIIRHLIAERIPITLVINKVDRLVLELRLPPADAYYKLKHTIEEVNTLISAIDPSPELRVSPEKGNVAFASTSMGWCFTLRSFAKMYADTYGGMDLDSFAERLWGNIYYSRQTRKFSKRSQDGDRAFVHFILEPLYKLYTQVLSSDTDKLRDTLYNLGITLKPALYKMDVRPLLKLVLNAFFGPASGLIDMIVQHVPDPASAAARKTSDTYTGPLEGRLAQSMLSCDPDGPLIVQIVKLIPSEDAEQFHAFGRVLSGTVSRGQRVRVLGEGYTLDDDEDSRLATIENVWVSQARYSIETDGMQAGNFVLLGGVDASISKTATIVDADIQEDLYIFRPIRHMTQSVLKVAVEPVHPSELPKMLEGLRKINKTYPLVETRVEESGEHIILGTGELYLDCVMHDLRIMFAGIEIKISDPVVRFCETVVDTSALKCYADTPNKKNKLTMIAEPMEKGIAEAIEHRKVTMKMPGKEIGKFFQGNFNWDLLASRSIWAFGPDEQGPNILMDDTLPSEVDKKLLFNVRDSIKQGFQWGTREGPLCDEPIRNVKFRLLDATLATEPIHRGGGQIIPTARRVCYSSFLMATPRLQEPVYRVEIQCPADSVSAVYTVLARRRGHVTRDIPKPGSSLYTVHALCPVIDANGLETDIRTSTNGQAFCQQEFDHWSIVPGDPTDKSIKLRPLEPSPAPHLARDFCLKTRRRKGLGDDIGVSKYLEADMIQAISASNEAMDLLY
ncbi:uncharacterized protein L969DRAFT_87919 [Mixia osmundae IAM 14324]|uniref:Tr-type G domain-containing protein n=1 Tax=Mixia osmundae (strain CBS 9802 / IAM 14324 / JCM 22182 / KY 12970) TaxID=764103 RepID=G7E215_MIXOS|nr:uncharacterized protein L969DRAFT_87919 [Mixia osmundae IAM 14324]KEI38688.1 hypothetical protein L969DRAFT_87919 [Mixia osmundae IAM 14324]GAA96852.1 hypothetical protein E5Q_03525 [Mixia osmundae IAM 14324]